MTKQILVIDDDDGIRGIIQISLMAVTSWEVITAASGQEGLTVAAANQPDAILLDVMMPDLDGWATLQQLQSNHLTQPIPVILLTAKANPQEYQRFIKEGVRGWITKPFKAQELVAQVKLLLNREE